MADVEGALPIAARRELRMALEKSQDPYIVAIPKVELHVHIEGTLTPELKWKIAQRNGMTLKHPRTGVVFTTLEELQDSHDTMKPRNSERMDNAEETLSFFEAYYGGFEVLKTRKDYYDLAMHYFERAAAMNVRYCEVFFDPQGHTRLGVHWETMMEGFGEAQQKAERDLNLKSSWIMCFLRDLSPDSAMEHYIASLNYRDMIVGIGLDSLEVDRPPMMFQEIFAQAKKDGFRITSHCDVGKAYPLEHIRQVVSEIGCNGGDRIDHGLNAVDSPELMDTIHQKGLGMTICPWSYIRHQPLDDVFNRIRTLFDAGIKLAIASDDPAFMEDTWILENFLVLKSCSDFSDKDIQKLAQDALEMSWAPEQVKKDILNELHRINIKSPTAG